MDRGRAYAREEIRPRNSFYGSVWFCAQVAWDEGGNENSLRTRIPPLDCHAPYRHSHRSPVCSALQSAKYDVT
jgi:hypothetical protein